MNNGHGDARQKEGGARGSITTAISCCSLAVIVSWSNWSPDAASNCRQNSSVLFGEGPWGHPCRMYYKALLSHRLNSMTRRGGGGAADAGVDVAAAALITSVDLLRLMVEALSDHFCHQHRHCH